MLQTMLVESPAWRGVFCCDGGGRDGAETDAPAFEDDDLERRRVAAAAAAVVDGSP